MDNIENSYYICGGTDCMDRREVSHYGFDLICSDGRRVSGTGLTSKEAYNNAKKEKQKVENFLSLSDKEQLKFLVDQEYILSSDMTRIVKLLTQIVLKNESNTK